MLEFLGIIHNVYASGGKEVIETTSLTTNGIISIIGLVALFAILITEKVDKTIVSVLIAGMLIFLQVFSDGNITGDSSQTLAFKFIYHNLDIFAFIIGMMIISGIAKDSGVFSYVALRIAKRLKGSPIKLFFMLSYMAFFMTVFISNIPTIIILAPIVILITKKLDIPVLPYIIGIITFANLGGAVTPISDPTTYYQATQLHLSFFQVISNTGLIMFLATIISSIYLYLIFRKEFKNKPDLEYLNSVKPIDYIKNKREMLISLSILLIVIILILGKEIIKDNFLIVLDNGSITLFGAFLAILFLKHNVSNILSTKVDYATLFFFAGLFVVVGSLEHNGIIEIIANQLVEISKNGNGQVQNNFLLLILTMGSAMLSVFIDNVPYNIAMVGTLQNFASSGLVTGGAWMSLAWGLNSCTSIGGAGSPIGSACNVIALGQAEKSGVLIAFGKYLMIGVPLVLLNSAMAYTVLYFRYLI